MSKSVKTNNVVSNYYRPTKLFYVKSSLSRVQTIIKIKFYIPQDKINKRKYNTDDTLLPFTD